MTTLNSQKHRNRFTVGALGVVFARVSITFAAPAHADTALVQDRLSRSIQAVASGLTMASADLRPPTIPQQKKKAPPHDDVSWEPFSLVREGGVEPPHPFEYTDLNRARLPIPPLALCPFAGASQGYRLKSLTVKGSGPAHTYIGAWERCFEQVTSLRGHFGAI